MQSTDQVKFDRLPHRLAIVAGLVPPCNRLIDIGTDHALLPIELIRHRVCQKAIAADIRSGPLAAAKHNITAAGLADKIETCLSDGLAKIELQPDDAVVIAGLGGYEMMDILGSQPRNCLGIILQPMKSTPELRQWLGRNGYLITDEDLADDMRRSYAVIRCHYHGEPCEMNPLQIQIGPILSEKKPEGFVSYLDRQIHRIEKQRRGEPQLGSVYEQLIAMRSQNRRDADV